MQYKYIIDKYSKDDTLEFKLYNNIVYLVNIFNKNGCKHLDYIERIAKQFDIATPVRVNSAILKQGQKIIDSFYNDYYLNNSNFILNRCYYLTFFFRNNRTLLCKI